MTTLDALATKYGIADSATNAFGQELVTPPELKKALLQAMGVDAGTEEQAQVSLNRLHAEEWKPGLPPVLVWYGDTLPVVSIVFPVGTANLDWTLCLESGEEFAGSFEFGRLPLEQSDTVLGQDLERRILQLPTALAWGYHRLQISSSPCVLIITPGKCYIPDHAAETKLWGIAVQLYLLRSERNWGIGDFTDLRTLIGIARTRNADVVGLNPLHAMFSDKPEDASPYSPSDRLLLNVLNIDIEEIPELSVSPEAQQFTAGTDFQQKLKDCRAADLVMYEEVAELKLACLRLIFAAFDRQEDPLRRKAFEDFQEERPELLDRACTFQALRAHFAAQKPPLQNLSQWPEEYRTCQAAGVADFVKEHEDVIRFHLWLQWIADTQLRDAALATEGMMVGLYRDLAVGSHPDGAEVWSYPQSLVADAHVGAPPDIWNPAGQNWGLPPLHPRSARIHAYQSFIDLLQANMRHAGALRIDHAMALQRLYWIPEGHEPKDGAYVEYPIEDLVGILALESHRNQCMVVGEDLGTVPPGFRERMSEANVFSYRVLFFEKERDTFIEPDRYPKLSLSVASSHDLPTLRGWWQGSDIEHKERLQLFPKPETAKEARLQREEDKDALVALLQERHFLDAGVEISTSDFCAAAHDFLASTQSLLTLVQIDDLAEEEEQVNVPSTSGENPNWRRRVSLSLEDLAADPRLTLVAHAMEREFSTARHAG